MTTKTFDIRSVLCRGKVERLDVPKEIAYCPECGGQIHVESPIWDDDDRPAVDQLDVTCLDYELSITRFLEAGAVADPPDPHSYLNSVWWPVRLALSPSGSVLVSMRLGVSLRQLREEYGYSQEEAAWHSGVPLSSLLAFESGETEASDEYMIWIVNAHHKLNQSSEA